jgi:hypothetical protein
MDETVCAEPECAASYKNHKWGTMKASADGWFMQKDGRSWCPVHLPEWVEKWRAQKST